MSRLFDDASSEYLHSGTSTPVTAYPFTFSAWGYSDVTNIVACMVALCDSGSASPRHGILFNNDATARILAHDVGGSTSAFTANTLTANTWHHICGMAIADDSRKVILDGDIGNQGIDTTSEPVGSTIDNVGIGAFTDSTASNFFSGRVAEAAVWNVELTGAEAVVLSKGYSPLFVRPASLVFYAPLYNTEDRDIVGGLTLTPVSTPSVADHTRVFMPSAQILQFPPAAAPVGGRIMSSLAYRGGLAHKGGIAGQGGGLAG